MQDLDTATRNLMNDIHAKTRRFYNTRSGAHIHEANYLATFIPDPDTAVIVNYCMPMENEVTQPNMSHALNLRQLLRDATLNPKWDGGNCNEFGRLFQENKGGIKCTNTCFFIKHSNVPQGRIPTYVKFVCAYKPHKADPYRVKMTVGGVVVKESEL
jgi:hypothetical protein